MTTLNIRTVPESVARGIRADAASRGITLSQWLTNVYALYQDLRQRQGTDVLLIDIEALRQIAPKKAVISGTEYTALDTLIETHLQPAARPERPEG